MLCDHSMFPTHGSLRTLTLIRYPEQWNLSGGSKHVGGIYMEFFRMHSFNEEGGHVVDRLGQDMHLLQEAIGQEYSPNSWSR